LRGVGVLSFGFVLRVAVPPSGHCRKLKDVMI